MQIKQVFSKKCFYGLLAENCKTLKQTWETPKELTKVKDKQNRLRDRGGEKSIQMWNLWLLIFEVGLLLLCNYNLTVLKNYIILLLSTDQGKVSSRTAKETGRNGRN